MNNFDLAKSKNFLLKESVELDEMAKIQGDLKSYIEKIIADNPDVAGLALKKIIRADQDVLDALDGEDLYDNQLNKFITLSRGERTLQQRGRKPLNNDTESLEEDSLDEMAKIAGDLKSAILSVMKQNPELNGLPLKKAIKGDDAVITALAGDTLYDNQLNKFIALAKGERTLNQTNAVNNDTAGVINKDEDELDVFKAPKLPKSTNPTADDFMSGDEEDNSEIDTTVKSDVPDDNDSVTKANMYKNIITKKVNKIESLPSNERANSVDMKALKQYIANPQISKLLGKDTIKSLVSTIIG